MSHVCVKTMGLLAAGCGASNSSGKFVVKESDDLFDKKRRWGRGIQIYRLVNGKF